MKSLKALKFLKEYKNINLKQIDEAIEELEAISDLMCTILDRNTELIDENKQLKK